MGTVKEGFKKRIYDPVQREISDLITKKSKSDPT
jgi:hypothetical protein